MFADLVIAIEEWHWVLSDELDSAKRKFNSQRFLVDRFQKPRTQRAVHADGTSNNLLGQLRLP